MKAAIAEFWRNLKPKLSRFWDDIGRAYALEQGYWRPGDSCICHEHKPMCDCVFWDRVREHPNLIARPINTELGVPFFLARGGYVPSSHTTDAAGLVPAIVAPGKDGYLNSKWEFVPRPVASDESELRREARERVIKAGIFTPPDDPYEKVARGIKEQLSIRELIREVCVVAADVVDEGPTDRLRKAVNRLRERAPYMCYPCKHRTCMHPEACTKLGKCSSATESQSADPSPSL